MLCRCCDDAGMQQLVKRQTDLADWVCLHSVQMRFRGSCDQLASTSGVFGGSLWLCYFSETELHLFNKCKLSISDGSDHFANLLISWYTIYRWWHCKAKATTLMVFWACDLGCVSVKASEFSLASICQRSGVSLEGTLFHVCLGSKNPYIQYIYIYTIM